MYQNVSASTTYRYSILQIHDNCYSMTESKDQHYDINHPVK
jgi:hypothetical protein